VLTALGVGAFLVVRPDGGEDGPLVTTDVDSIGAPMVAGHRAAYSATLLANTSDEPLVLLSARFVDTSPGFHSTGAYVIGPGRRWGAVAAFDPFPNRMVRREGVPVEPLRGYVVRPFSERDSDGQPFTAELVLVFRVPPSGRHFARSVEVTYRQGSQIYRERLPRSFFVCVVQKRPAEFDGECAGDPPTEIPRGSVLGL
jgi:hypothetical protein